MSDENDDDEEEMYAVLTAMSAQLITEKQFQETKSIGNSNLHNSLIVTHKTEKPSGDMFYRDTNLYSNKLPQLLKSKHCDCNHVCKNAIATIQCYSCAIYQPDNQAYYCDECFKSRHPWYREAHQFESIQNDEDIVYNMKLSKQSANFKRVEYESKVISQTLNDQHNRLAYIKDHTVDDQIRKVGRNFIKCEAKIHDMKDNYDNEVKELRNIFRIKNSNKIQAAYRGHLVRRTVSLMYVTRILCVWDIKNKTCKSLFVYIYELLYVDALPNH